MQNIKIFTQADFSIQNFISLGPYKAKKMQQNKVNCKIKPKVKLFLTSLPFYLFDRGFVCEENFYV